MAKATCNDCGLVRYVHNNRPVPIRCKKCHHVRQAKNKAPKNIYRRWAGMVNRCTNPSNPAYKRYGARGITVCAEWRNDSVAFWKWALSAGYTEGTKLTLDRIDNDKGYYPDNCRFATRDVQSQNTRRLSTKNTSGYRGVSKDDRDGTYVARVVASNRRIRVGRFHNAKDAGIARDKYVVTNNLSHTLNFTREELGTFRDPEPVPAHVVVRQTKTNIKKVPKAPPRGNTGYYGVDKEPNRKGYRVGMSVNGKHVRLGTHPTPEAAALVRDKYVVKHKLLDRHLNFPELVLKSNL